MKWLFSPPSYEDINRLLKAWRFWLLVSLLGGLAGAAIYWIAPPPYRARATVVVDFNLEEAFTPTADKQVFYYLEREVHKLEGIAWSDLVMQQVASETGGVGVFELRDGVLLLGQPSEGGWHFWAEDADSRRAEVMASAWAKAFTEQVRATAVASMMLQSYHAAIENGCVDCSDLEARIAELEAQAKGITPYVEVGLTQSDNLPVTRKVHLSAYILAGAVIGLVLAAFLVLFLHPLLTFRNIN
jgi:hypothetical protein